MKILKINESNNAEFSIDGTTYKPITEIGKSDIYGIIKKVLLDKDGDVEMDDPSTMNINNDAHKLIYADLYGKLIELKTKSKNILETIQSEVQPVIDKYDIDLNEEKETELETESETNIT